MPQKTLITRSKGKVAFHGNTKFAYNCPRLLAEVEQILTEGTLDLERNREQLKAIRRGEWTKEQLYQYFNDKERQLEEAFHKSTLPVVPDVARIKSLLLECLEHHYGSLSKVVIIPEKTEEALRQIELICQKALRQ